jgi:hypothetical protein
MRAPRLSTGASPIYPSPIVAQLAHADRFASSLRALYDDAVPGDPAALWLTGRADEVRVFVADVLRESAHGRIESTRGAELIAGFLLTLHAALEPWYGRWYVPSCCGPFARGVGSESGIRHASPGPVPNRLESRADTLTDLAAHVPSESLLQRVARSA